MSSATVIAVSATSARCGQATSAISGSADPHSCRMMCHLNHGSGVAAKELVVRPADLTDEPEHRPRADARPRTRPAGRATPRGGEQHGQQRERRQQQADVADDQPGRLPIRKRASTSAAYTPAYTSPATAQFIWTDGHAVA